MVELEEYIINYETLILVPYEKDKTKVYEGNNVYVVNQKVLSIIKKSCLYFGSSFEGRKQGTKELLNCEIKLPIIIEDSRNLIIFPTSSYKRTDTIWLAYQNMVKYRKETNNTTTIFFDNLSLNIDVKYNIIDNQIIRCIKLDTITKKRKNILLSK